MVIIKTVSENTELSGILQLQQENLRSFIGEEEAIKEGFLTAVYDSNLLQAMHAENPSIIAKDGDRVVGYALVTGKQMLQQHPLLADLFYALEKINYRGFPLKEAEYIAVGQLCVARNYRGEGLVQKMYQLFREKMQNRHPYCITDVARANPRSLKAHVKTGFEVIDSLVYGGAEWDIVLWDWKNNRH